MSVPPESQSGGAAAVEIGLAIVFHPGDAGKVLIALRPEGTHLAGYWEFPGGKVEADETAAECAIREALEETGLTVEAVGALPGAMYEYPGRVVRLHPVLCRVSPGRTMPEGLHWADAAQLRETRFPPANAPIVDALIDLLNTR